MPQLEKQWQNLNLDEVKAGFITKLKLSIPKITIWQAPDFIMDENGVFMSPSHYVDHIYCKDILMQQITSDLCTIIINYLREITKCGNIHFMIALIHEKWVGETEFLLQMIFNVIVLKPIPDAIPSEYHNIHWYDENKKQLCLGKPNRNVRILQPPKGTKT